MVGSLLGGFFQRGGEWAMFYTSGKTTPLLWQKPFVRKTRGHHIKTIQDYNLKEKC